MRQLKGRHLKIANSKKTVDDALFRDEVTPRPWSIVEGERKDTPQITHRIFGCINRQCLATAQVAKPAAVIEPHDVVGMRMRENDRVEPADVLSQALDAKFRCRIDNDL